MLGSRYETNHGAQSITASGTSQELAARDDSRMQLIITNDSEAKAYLGLGKEAVSGKGIMLRPEGGSFVLDQWTGSVFVVGNGNVTWVEF